MTVDVLNRSAAQVTNASRLAISDCDIHPRAPGKSIGGVSTSLFPYLSKQWRDHITEFGVAYRQQWEKGPAFPKNQPAASRRDSWPESGGGPGQYQRRGIVQKDPYNKFNVSRIKKRRQWQNRARQKQTGRA